MDVGVRDNTQILRTSYAPLCKQTYSQCSTHLPFPHNLEYQRHQHDDRRRGHDEPDVARHLRGHPRFFLQVRPPGVERFAGPGEEALGAPFLGLRRRHGEVALAAIGAGWRSTWGGAGGEERVRGERRVERRGRWRGVNEW